MDPLLACSLAFLLGSLAGPDAPLAMPTLVPLAGLHALSHARPMHGARRATLLVLCCAAGLALAARAVPVQLGGGPRTETLRGTVRSVERLASETRLVLESPRPPFAPRVRVLLRPGVDAEVGSRIVLRGRLLPPRDRGDHLTGAAQGVRAVLLDGQVLEASPGSPGLLLRARRATEARLLALHPGDTGALLAGLLTGGRGAISAAAKDDVRRTGLAHIVAISGANFALLIGLCERLLRGQRRRTRLGLLTGLTLGFWGFVDGGTAVSRAAVTTLAVLFAAATGRTSGGTRALVLATVVLVLVSPLALRADASLQLSALATMGVLWTGGFDGLRTPSVLEWRQTLSMSLATSAATLPVQLTVFGSTSLVAPAANLLALPLIPVAMAAGAAEFALGWIPAVGIVLHGVSQLALGGILLVARLCAGLPFASVPLPTLPGWSHAPLLAAGFALPAWLLLRRRTAAP